VVAFVCEGSTDAIVLRRIVEQVLGPIESLPLQPQTDELDRIAAGIRAGWSEVRAWCERTKSFDEYFDPSIGEPIDLLVIVLDLDIADRAGVQKLPSTLKAYDAKALCNVIKSWLPSPLRWRVLIAIPVTSIESWILAALFPRRRTAPELEPDPTAILAAHKKIPMGRNGPWKRVAEYRGLANIVAARLDRVRSACTEADRFVRKLETAARLLQQNG
jgi:hypothetical protein